jgi:hypothetical protein
MTLALRTGRATRRLGDFMSGTCDAAEYWDCAVTENVGIGILD